MVGKLWKHSKNMIRLYLNVSYWEEIEAIADLKFMVELYIYI